MPSKQQSTTNSQARVTQSDNKVMPDAQSASATTSELEQELEQKILAQAKKSEELSAEDGVFAPSQVSIGADATASEHKHLSQQEDDYDISTDLTRQKEQTLAELEAAMNDTALPTTPVIPQEVSGKPLPPALQSSLGKRVSERTSPMSPDATPKAEKPLKNATLSIPTSSETESSVPQNEKQEEESVQAVRQDIHPLTKDPSVMTIPSDTPPASPDRQSKTKTIAGQKSRTGIRFTDSLVRPLRTYRDDVARAIQQKNASMVSVISAEADRRNRIASSVMQQEAVRSASPKFFIFVALGALLVGAGAAVLAWTFLIYPTQSSPIPTASIPSFIFVEEQWPLDITDRSSSQISNLLYASRDAIELSLGGVAQLYFVEDVETNDPEEPLRTILVSSERLFDLMGMRMPASLVRSIDKNVMFGFHAFDNYQPFFIFKTALYENTFAGMLDWERTMKGDMELVFEFPVALSTTTATSTGEGATTTSGNESKDEDVSSGTVDNLESLLRTNRPFVEPFRDRVVRNKDTRVLEDSNGKILLVYAFPDRETVVLTTNEFTLNEIISRLNSIQF